MTRDRAVTGLVGAAARAARRGARATGRSGRCSACRSRSREGKVLALLGSNGAGKTTVARVCSGLVSPTTGEVLFEGGTSPAARLPPRPARHRPRARRAVGVRVADRRGEPHPRVPAASSGGGRAPAARPRAYELFPRLGRAPQAGRRHALGRRAAHARPGPGARAPAPAARRRRAVARSRADHHRRGVPDARRRSATPGRRC